jgi:hypothetical protein
VIHECLLNRTQVVSFGEAFDCDDLRTGDGDSQRQATVDAPSVDQNGACAALAVVASLLAAGQVHVLAQRVEQHGARVEIELLGFAVDIQRYVDAFYGSGFGLMRGLRGGKAGKTRCHGNAKRSGGFDESTSRYALIVGAGKAIEMVRDEWLRFFKLNF